MTPQLLRIVAAVLIVVSGVVFSAGENSRLFAALLIAGNLLSLLAHFVGRRSGQ